MCRLLASLSDAVIIGTATTAVAQIAKVKSRVAEGRMRISRDFPAFRTPSVRLFKAPVA
jgi:hypothetical protein